MVYEYEITDIALEEIDSAVKYILNFFSNKKAATDLLDEIEKKYK